MEYITSRQNPICTHFRKLASSRAYREETGDGEAYYLPLPAATEETLGSRRHPGPVFHEACARTTAGFLREIL